MEASDHQSTRTPVLTVVATARNDNHGGNLLRRVQSFLNCLHEQSERFQVHTELVLVEWNPPKNAESLRQALTWPSRSPWFESRVVEVPYESHARFLHADVLPLYQMIAKNVGVRRARGEFILCTNIDILFEDAIFEFIGDGRLERGKIYRTDRYDVDENIPTKVPIDELLDFCRNNIVRLNSWKGSNHLVLDDCRRHYSDDAELRSDEYKEAILHTNACGDFQLTHRDHWFQLRGYAEFDMYSFHIDSLFEYAAHYVGLEEVKLGEPYRIYHIEHPSSGWKPEQAKDPRHDEAIRTKKLAQLTNEQLSDFRVLMANDPRSCVINSENWGLGSTTLPAYRMTTLQEPLPYPPQPLSSFITKTVVNEGSDGVGSEDEGSSKR